MNFCCAERSETPRSPLVQLIPAVSRPAPPWSAVAIIDLKMQELSSQHFAGKYLVLLFYPCDFSFTCPTELIQFSDRIAEFRDLGTKLHFSSPLSVLITISPLSLQITIFCNEVERRRILVKKKKDSSNKRLQRKWSYFMLNFLCALFRVFIFMITFSFISYH